MFLLNDLSPEPAPIAIDEHGVARVGGTRVQLETVIDAFNEGSTAEEILLRYPSLALKDIYSVLAYYQWHQREIDAYVAERHGAAEKTRQEIEVRFPPAGIRERLMAR